MYKAIEALKNGSSIQDISSLYKYSLDKSKKLSQIANMQKFISTLPEELRRKFSQLGFKALVLNPLFKNKDLEGIKEILEKITVDIKRDELKQFPKALYEKRKDIEKAKSEAARKMKELIKTQEEISARIIELDLNKKKIEETLTFLSGASEKAKAFLMEHLGVANGKYVLYKRLDISWQNSLKQKNVIAYNECTYTWEINNLEELTKQAERRIKNNNNMLYDPDKARGIYSSWYPSNPYYKNALGLDTSILDSIKANERELKQLSKKKSEISKSLKKMKSSTIHGYICSAEVSNVLSQNRIIAHKRLQNYAMRYLFTEGFITGTEISHKSFRFDVLGINENEVIIIEAKASISDFKSDNKFYKYIPYCNKLFFVFDMKTYLLYSDVINNKIEKYGVGILVQNDDDISVIKDSNTWSMDDGTKNALKFSLSRELSRNFIYGK